MDIIKRTIIVGAGGFLGTVLRALCGKVGIVLFPIAFPLGTFVANMAGCFLIGLFNGWASKRRFMTGNLNVFLTAGLCGGFTTYSMFSYEMFALLKTGSTNTFVIYLATSLIVGLMMVAAGMACVRHSSNQQLQMQ